MPRVVYTQEDEAKYQDLRSDDGVHCAICGNAKDRTMFYPPKNVLSNPHKYKRHNMYKFSICMDCYRYMITLCNREISAYNLNIEVAIDLVRNRVRRKASDHKIHRKGMSQKQFNRRWNLHTVGKYLDGHHVIGIFEHETHKPFELYLWATYVTYRDQLMLLEGQALRAKCEELFPDQRFVELIITCYNN